MKLEIDLTVPKLIVHAYKDNLLWASSGYTIYKSKDRGKNWQRVTKIQTSFSLSFLSCFRVSERLLDLGIHNIILLESGSILACADSKIYHLNNPQNVFNTVHKLRRGRRPLPQGITKDKDGNIYYGEYWMNFDHEPVHIYGSFDKGMTWEPVYTFPDGSIYHIHAVQYDCFSDKLWIATGDRDKECRIAYSEDKGISFREIGSGSQKWRAVSLMFAKDYVYWGTDAPNEQNYIYRWKRSNGGVEELTKVDGPIYYSTVLNNRIIVAATTVENGGGEWDNFSHVWASADGKNWEDLAKWEKDRYSIFHFGVIRFAQGQDPENYLYFSGQSLKEIDKVFMRAKIIE